MQKLLKLYLLDYLKKSIMVIIGAVLFGTIILSPIAESMEERIIYINWASYIALYGLFFYNYPLSGITKWSMNVPINRSELIIFNIIFQALKLIITSIYLIVIGGLQAIIYPDIIANSKIIKYQKAVSALSTNLRVTDLISWPMSSSYLMIGILLTIFFISFIFNVAPYGPFKNFNPTNENIKDWVKYLYYKYKKQVILVIIILVCLAGLKQYYYSKAFLGALSITGVLFLVYRTYHKVLLFSNQTHKYFTICSLLIFTFSWFSFLKYSNYVLSSNKLSTAKKISEFEFQGKLLIPTKEEHLIKLLEDTNLCLQDINKISDLSTKFFPKKFYKNISNKIDGYPHFNHMLTNINFNNIVLKKSQKCGLTSFLGLFDLQKISFKNMSQYLDRWEELSINNNRDQLRLYKKLKPFPFKLKHYKSFLSNKNQIKIYLALKYIENSNNQKLKKHLLENITNLNSENTFIASTILSKQACRTISSVDLISKNNIYVNHSTCGHQVKIENILLL